MQIDAWTSQGVLLPFNESSWQHNVHYMLIKQTLRKISDSLFSSTYPHGNENNRNRAVQLLKSGSM